MITSIASRVLRPAMLCAALLLGGCVAYADGPAYVAEPDYSPPAYVGVGGWWGGGWRSDDGGRGGWRGGGERRSWPQGNGHSGNGHAGGGHGGGHR